MGGLNPGNVPLPEDVLLTEAFERSPFSAPVTISKFAIDWFQQDFTITATDPDVRRLPERDEG